MKNILIVQHCQNMDSRKDSNGKYPMIKWDMKKKHKLIMKVTIAADSFRRKNKASAYMLKTNCGTKEINWYQSVGMLIYIPCVIYYLINSVFILIYSDSSISVYIYIYVYWSNPEKGIVPSSSPQCYSYWKGSLWITLDYSWSTFINGPGDRGSISRSSHTKDSKNGTWYCLA